jgi:hypothetical protein
VSDQTPSADILIKFVTGLEGVRRAFGEVSFARAIELWLVSQDRHGRVDVRPLKSAGMMLIDENAI